MRATHTIKLSQDAYAELQNLSETLGYPPELAATYAIRLVSACYREGLITDTPSRAWPCEVRPESAAYAGGRVIAFPRGASGRRLRRRTSDGQ